MIILSLKETSVRRQVNQLKNASLLIAKHKTTPGLERKAFRDVNATRRDDVWIREEDATRRDDSARGDDVREDATREKDATWYAKGRSCAR